MTTDYEKRTPEQRRAERDAACLSVLVATCTTCKIECRHCPETGLTTDVGPCLNDQHDWRYVGSSHVAGDRPWKANVPGVLPPGFWDLREGERVYVSFVAYTVPKTGKYEVFFDDEGTLQIKPAKDFYKAMRPGVK